MKKYALVTLLLSFALTAQAWVSADHFHLDHTAEVECQICSGTTDLAPEVAMPANFSIEPHALGVPEAVLAVRASMVRQCSRGPPLTL